MASSTRGLTDDTRRSDGRSIGDLVGAATSELSLLVRKEVELAKLEMKEQGARAADSAKYLGIAAFCGYLTAVLLSVAAAWGLAEAVPAGVAFLIVAVILGVVAGVAFLAGRERIRKLHPVPEATVETLKEDVQWLKSRKSSN
jgi:uncharacterized membrane protein YqjE